MSEGVPAGKAATWLRGSPEGRPSSGGVWRVGGTAGGPPPKAAGSRGCDRTGGEGEGAGAAGPPLLEAGEPP